MITDREYYSTKEVNAHLRISIRKSSKLFFLMKEIIHVFLSGNIILKQNFSLLFHEHISKFSQSLFTFLYVKVNKIYLNIIIHII